MTAQSRVNAPGTTWKKAKVSASSNACVEVDNSLSMIRDSKNPEGPALRVNAVALAEAINSGRIVK